VAADTALRIVYVNNAVTRVLGEGMHQTRSPRPVPPLPPPPSPPPTASANTTVAPTTRTPPQSPPPPSPPPPQPPSASSTLYTLAASFVNASTPAAEHAWRGRTRCVVPRDRSLGGRAAGDSNTGRRAPTQPGVSPYSYTSQNEGRGKLARPDRTRESPIGPCDDGRISCGFDWFIVLG